MRLYAGCTVKRDDRLLKTVYGPDVLPDDVLAGRVAPPKEVRTCPNAAALLLLSVCRAAMLSS